ncbi:hypothetical protein GW17_00000685, partial [Ensete ventricosum]
LWLVLGVFLMATSLRMYATCQQLQAQAQAHAAAASGFLGGTELRLHVPPSIAFATRGRLQSLRLQLALLDREFDDLASFVYYLSDYDALRALDSDNPPDAPSMTEEEINALPVHKYKVQFSSRQRQDQILYLYMDFVFSNGGSVLQQASSSSISATELPALSFHSIRCVPPSYHCQLGCPTWTNGAAASDSHEGRPRDAGQIGIGERIPIRLGPLCPSHDGDSGAVCSMEDIKRRPDCLRRDDDDSSDGSGESNRNTSLRRMASTCSVDGPTASLRAARGATPRRDPMKLGQRSTHSTTIWGAAEKMPWSQAILCIRV